MSRFIFQSLIFFLPLFFWPSPLKFELAKISLFLTGGFLLVFLFLAKLKIKNFEIHFKNLDKIWFLWVGILLLSTLITQIFPYGFLAGGYRHQSVLFFFLLGLFGLIAKGLGTKNAKIVLKWASAAIIIETLIIYAQWLAIRFDFPILSYNQRPIGTIGEPNAVTGFLALGLPILVVTFQQPLISVIAVIIAILLTGSKAGLLAILAELIVFGFFWKRKFPYKKFILITSLFLIVIIGIFGVYFERGESRFENRWLIWDLGIRAIQEKPILGYGAEGIISAYDKQFSLIDRPLFGVVVDRSHNLFLDITLFSGIIGLVVFGLWLWRASQKLLKKRSWVLASLTGFLIFSFFQPIGVTHWFYLIILVSLTDI
ncbi:MAG TPA: O-antigen ligase family protein [Patescibacteria group bacterium]|nr:O-antigen ligase family protein [Patescibacteria group bacterium]